MRHTYAEFKEKNGTFYLFSSYSSDLVASLKALPATSRRWDKTLNAWAITPQYAQDIAQIVQRTLGISMQLPISYNAAPVHTTRVVRLEYLGQAKDRGDGTLTAFGHDGQDWAFVFPLAVLKAWFCEDAKPDEAPTLYAVLGIKQTATVDEIKSAYRRAARTWHPDLCHEPDAAEQFRIIRHAYDILGDATMLAKYNAGLKLAAYVRTSQQASGPTWKPPLRCGLLLVEATVQLGRLAVTRILQWNDIMNTQGQILVTSWPFGATTYEVRWV